MTRMYTDDYHEHGNSMENCSAGHPAGRLQEDPASDFAPYAACARQTKRRYSDFIFSTSHSTRRKPD